MATNVINGSDLFVFMGGTVVAHGTSHTLTITRTNRLTSSKETGKYVSRKPGRLDITCTESGLMVYGSFEALEAAQDAQTPVTLTFGKKTVGNVLDTSETYATGTFYIKSLELNAPDGDNATYTASFETAGTFNFTKV